MEKELVHIDDHGLLGSNFYWQKGKEIGLSKEELAAVGLYDDRALVHPDLIAPLQRIDAILQKGGFRLYIKEGYRSKELYGLINKKIQERIGEAETGRILNMIDMPHATGRAIDVTLWKDGEPVPMKDKTDGIDGYFIDFYKGKGAQGERFYALQTMLIGIMQDNGFRLGTKREYFHFNYDPQSPRNYPQ